MAAGAGLFSRGLWAAEESTDPNTFVLLADIHVCQDRDRENRAVRPVPAFEQVRDMMLSVPVPRPAAAIVAGDCAFREGLPGDYAMLASLLKPLRRAGMTVHLTLGNHDHRANFRAAFPEACRPPADVESLDRCVAVVETPRANWFLLDSLDQTNVTPGQLGELQLEWLAKALDARPDKPALVVAHHNPNGHAQPAGLVDWEGLLDVILPRRQVKAYCFGHTHCWRIDRREDLYLINVPAVVWTFDPVQPRGCVSARLRDDGATLALWTSDPKHPDRGKPIELSWRTC